MLKIKKGDKVGRISYGKDIVFEVTKVLNLSDGKKIAMLKGVTERIVADSDIADLEIIERKKIDSHLKFIDRKLEERIEKKQNKDLHYKKEENRVIRNYQNGTILHLDGDRKYSEKSMRYYRRIGLKAVVKNIPENKQSLVVYSLLKYYRPDILVVTRT